MKWVLCLCYSLSKRTISLLLNCTLSFETIVKWLRSKNKTFSVHTNHVQHILSRPTHVYCISWKRRGLQLWIYSMFLVVAWVCELQTYFKVWSVFVKFQKFAPFTFALCHVQHKPLSSNHENLPVLEYWKSIDMIQSIQYGKFVEVPHFKTLKLVFVFNKCQKDTILRQNSIHMSRPTLTT